MHKHLAFECRAAELEVEEVVGQPLRLSGLALPYMVQAVDRREQFRAGSLTWKTVLLRSLHTQGISPPLAIHPGGVALDDREDGLFVRAELPDTTAARDAVALVKAGNPDRAIVSSSYHEPMSSTDPAASQPTPAPNCAVSRWLKNQPTRLALKLAGSDYTYRRRVCRLG